MLEAAQTSSRELGSRPELLELDLAHREVMAGRPVGAEAITELSRAGECLAQALRAFRKQGND